ncbi:MAG: LuxR C-terminal-related transcriptional regulator [Azospirillaceae bacterium]
MATSAILPLIATKLRPPSLPAGVVARPRLFVGAGRLPQRRLTIVEAPPGFGKTTCLTQWHDALIADGVPACWLSLDSEDDGLPLFLAYLVGALQTIHPTFAKDALGQLLSAQESAVNRHAFGLLVNEMAAIDHPFVVFIDDFHVIANPQITEFLGKLALRGPTSMRLVIASRVAPGLPLSRLRMTDSLWEVGPRELRFTAEEIERFFAGHPDMTVEGLAAASLLRQTEGWVAGLRLASLSWHRLGGGNRLEAFAASADVFDFFMDEVFRTLPEALQAFLVRTSRLDRMSAGVCDAIMGRQDSVAVLDLLVSRNIFTQPLDTDRTWFRYHALFSQFLRNRAQSLGQTAIAEIDSRAGAWFEANGHHREAVRHLLAAGEMERAAAIIESRCLFDYLSYGLFDIYHGWLASLPDAVLNARPLLMLLHVWRDINSRNYERADRTLRDVEQRLDRTQADTGSPLRLLERVRLFDCLVAAYSGDMARFHALTESLGGTVIDDGPFGQVDLDSILGFGHLHFGALDRSLDLTWRAHGKYKAIDCYWGLVHSKAIAGMATLARGRVVEAETYFQDALEIARANFASTSYMVGLSSVLLGLVRYECDGIADAEALLRSGALGTAEIDRAGLDDRHVVGYVTLSRLLAATGRAAEAMTVLDRGDSFALETGNVRLSLAIRNERARLFLLAGRLGEAQRESDHLMAGLAEQSGRLPPLVWQVWEPAHAVRVLINVSRRRFSAALEALKPLLDRAVREERLHSVAVLQALTGIAQSGQGLRKEAARSLSQALRIGADCGIARSLVDLGPDFTQCLSLHAEALGLRAANEGWADFLQAIERLAGAKGGGIALGDDRGAPTLYDLLSERERQITGLVARGLTNREIGLALGIREQTVKTHLKNVFSKLSVRNRTQAAEKARQIGFV